jgi:hypothetical protein
MSQEVRTSLFRTVGNRVGIMMVILLCLTPCSVQVVRPLNVEAPLELEGLAQASARTNLPPLAQWTRKLVHLGVVLQDEVASSGTSVHHRLEVR